MVLEAELYGFGHLGVLQKDVSNCYSLVLKALVLLASFIPAPFQLFHVPSHLRREFWGKILFKVHVCPFKDLQGLSLKPLHCCRFLV